MAPGAGKTHCPTKGTGRGDQAQRTLTSSGVLGETSIFPTISSSSSSSSIVFIDIYDKMIYKIHVSYKVTKHAGKHWYLNLL